MCFTVAGEPERSGVLGALARVGGQAMPVMLATAVGSWASMPTGTSKVLHRVCLKLTIEG